MGQRSGTATASAVLTAFLRQPTWSQADLAREVGVSTKAIRACLEHLSALNVPLQSEHDPPHVYWSVPKKWFPGGVLVESSQVETIVRLLSRLPKTKERDAVIRQLLSGTKSGPADASTVVTQELDPDEAIHLATVEDSARQRVALRTKYFSTRSGALEWRHISVQRVLPAPPSRAAGFCHRDGKLKWWRVDRMTRAELDGAEPFRAAAIGDVEAFLLHSVDGYAGDGAAIECVFSIGEAEWRWLEKSLPTPQRIERASGEIRVTIATRGILPLARKLVGLGGLARPESPELRTIVESLALGALDSVRGGGTESS